MLGPVWALTSCIEDAVKIKFNPEKVPFACVFADIAKAYPSVPRPELMDVLKKSGVPSELLNRGLMEHARYRVKNNGGHDHKCFHMSLGLKEGCPAAPIFIMNDLKSRLLENPDENICVGFDTEEFNDLPLIREYAPTKKIRWARKVEQMSKPVNLLLFADDTTSMCRKSNMQHRKEMLKQAFKDWKLILNDDKWEHIIAENDPEERETTAEVNGQNSKNTRCSSECLGHVSSRSKKKRLMAARNAWFKLSQKFPSWALSKKVEGQIATAVVGATLLFGCEVRGFSSKYEREYEALWSRVVFGITRQKRRELEQDKKTLADLRIMCTIKPILDLIRIRQLNYLASLARLPDDRLEKLFFVDT